MFADAAKLTSSIGNHDITLDADFYARHGLCFHNQHPQSSMECVELLTNSPSITYLDHGSANIRLAKPDGPRTAFKVFGSPYSPARGLWAFGYDSLEKASRLWDQIPSDTDVVVTHTPPKYHCDESTDRGSAGCEALRQTLWRVRPRLAICGHVHEGRGAERILWDLDAPNITYKENHTLQWIDPGQDNKKQSIIDLTFIGGADLDNTAVGDETQKLVPVPGHYPYISPSRRLPTSNPSMAFKSRIQSSTMAAPPVSNECIAAAALVSSIGPQPTEWLSSYNPTVTNEASSVSDAIEGAVTGTRGHGGIPISGCYDAEVLSGRMGRKETCVINAAIRASSWSPRRTVGKQFNKAIVVDIDLPVWGDVVDDTLG